MCGIAGIVGCGAANHMEALRRMTGAQSHRGPDGEGFYAAQSGICAFGHRRLSILDLSAAAAQPMVLHDGRHAFCYNGECYNFQSLRAELLAKGESLHSTGDTETMLKHLARDGAACLPKLNGMFAFGFWDEEKRTLLLGRDRFGQKPLYYAFANAGSGGSRMLLFASEIRALLASGLVERQANPRAIHSYLRYGAVQGPETIVAGVQLLPAASYLVWSENNAPRIDKYWSPPASEAPRRALPPRQLRDLFVEAVERHMVSDAPIGLFLSGGIDSSAITAAASRLHKNAGRVITLSVVFPDQPGQSESAHARRIGERRGTDHREVPVTGRQMLDLLPQTLDSLDQPSIDGANTSIVSFAARQAGLKVALSGLGGDELFGGYPAFWDVPRMMRLHRALGPFRRPAANVLRGGARNFRAGGGSSPASARGEFAAAASLFSVRKSKLIDLFESPGGVLPAYLIRRQLFSSGQIAALAPSGNHSEYQYALSDQTRREYQSMIEGASGQEAVSLLELSAYMGQTLLRDSDVMGMSHSLEIRTPFLDNSFTDSVLSARPEDRFAPPSRSGAPKGKFIEAMGDWLPAENVNRRKQGFTLPFSEWMRGELRDHTAQGFSAIERCSGFFDSGMAQRLLAEFHQRPLDIGWARPWSLFVLGRFLERHKLTL